MKMPISRSNAFRRSILAVATARKGDPNATLNAYPVTRRPALGDRDAKIAGNVRQQPHDDEFSGTDAKRGQSESQQRKTARGGSSFRCERHDCTSARGPVSGSMDWSHLHLCCLLPQALPSELK